MTMQPATREAQTKRRYYSEEQLPLHSMQPPPLVALAELPSRKMRTYHSLAPVPSVAAVELQWQTMRTCHLPVPPLSLAEALQ